MALFKTEIVKLGESTILSNNDIAKIVGCSIKTVNKYIGSHSARCREKASQDGELFEVQRTVLLPDIHYPHVDDKLMASVADFIVDYNPHELVYMGDQMSLDCISGWNKYKPLLKEGQRLINEYVEFDKNILEWHEDITDKDIRRTFIIGNHEERVEWYIERNPELQGIIDVDANLKLTERGYKVVPFGGIHRVGKLNVIHGYYWNKYHAVKTLDAFEGNVVYAHVHNPQMYAKVSPIDRKGYHTATSLPCLCNIKPDYKKNAPNFWINGFAVVEHLPATGFFNLYTIIAIDGCFMWGGKYYGKDL